MSLTAGILGAIEQAGLLDELKGISFPAGAASIMYENMDIVATFDNGVKNDE